MNDGTDWTEELIGSPDPEPRDWTGLLEAVAPLTWLEPPEDLERAADTLEALERAGAVASVWTGEGRTVDWLRGLAELARSCVALIEADGLEWDWSRREVVGPADGTPGRPRGSLTLAVGAAFEQAGGKDREDWYGAATLAAIRDRLTPLLPDRELTDAKIRGRLQRYLRR